MGLATSITPQAAALELLARRAAATSFGDYVRYLDSVPPPAAHHELMIRELEQLEAGHIDRLMLLLPPGSAKSTYASILFPGYYMGRNPTNNVIAVSHTAELSERFGRRVRNQVDSTAHRAVFGVGVSKDSASAGRWENQLGGDYFAAGIGGSVTGRRADLAIIDDPVRGREDADSKTTMNSHWAWYQNDLVTRLKPGARQILIQTRWSEDDLAGRLLDSEPDLWRVVKVPMLAVENDPLGRVPGARLWEEWFTPAMITAAQQNRRAWTALYQQEPAPEDGDYFRRDWFAEYDGAPEGLTIYIASDFAVTEDAGDYTEIGVFGIDFAQNIYVLDWYRGQSAPDVWVEELCRLILKHRPMIVFGESGVIRRATEPFMVKRMMERNAYAVMEWLPSVNEKTARARGFQARASMGKVFLPKKAPWKDALLDQLLKFPAGKWDDGVDVCSLIGRGLDQVISPPSRIAKKTEYNLGANAWLGA